MVILTRRSNNLHLPQDDLSKTLFRELFVFVLMKILSLCELLSLDA
jgi:hypothetical protein